MTLQEIEERQESEQLLSNALPHGSGIDADWTFDYQEDKIICHNSYHGMTEHGMYEGWQDFAVVLFAHRKDVTAGLRSSSKTYLLHRSGDIDWYLDMDIDNNDNRDFICGLDEYLGDTIQYALSIADIIS